MEKMKHICLIAVLSAGLFSGCSVMHFKNGSADNSGRVNENWHHNMLFSLLEASKPLNMKTLCPGGWVSVTTKETFVTGLVGGIDNALTSVLLPPGGIDVWDPQAVEWVCGEGGGIRPADTTATSAPMATFR